LGTRAVDRVDDDYTRIVALNAPSRRPEVSSEDIRKYTQHKTDILDFKSNQHVSRSFEDVVRDIPNFPLNIFASRDLELERRSREFKQEKVFSWTLTFDELLSKTEFVHDMRAILSTLEEAYAHPVDIEFTTNFVNLEKFRINLLQCRTFQVKGNILSCEPPAAIARENIVVESKGPVIGGNVATTVDRLIYVVPEVYSKMKEQDRYAVARLIGRLTKLTGKKQPRPVVMLMGPGRWATTTPSLGVPVTFSEISPVSVLCEMVTMHEGLVPEVSLGTHFFNDLVEMDMLYFAVYPQKYDNTLNKEFFAKAQNNLAKLLPDAAKWSEVVVVIDSAKNKGEQICLNSNVLRQQVMCYLGGKSKGK